MVMVMVIIIMSMMSQAVSNPVFVHLNKSWSRPSWNKTGFPSWIKFGFHCRAILDFQYEMCCICAKLWSKCMLWSSHMPRSHCAKILLHILSTDICYSNSCLKFGLYHRHQIRFDLWTRHLCILLNQFLVSNVASQGEQDLWRKSFWFLSQGLSDFSQILPLLPNSGFFLVKKVEKNSSSCMWLPPQLGSHTIHVHSVIFGRRCVMKRDITRPDMT